MSFAEWHVLEVTDRLIREKDEPVSQLEVSRRTELSKSSVSELIHALRRHGLVDVGPDQWGVSDRILIAQKGEQLLVALRQELGEVARALVSTRVA